MEITREVLEKMDACKHGVEWVAEQGETDARKLIGLAMDAGRFPDCNWFVTRIMNREQCVQYAVHAAELALSIFEDRYPDDPRPRRAVGAAKTGKRVADAAAADADAAAAAAADADAAAAAAAYAAAYAAAAAAADAAAAAAAAAYAYAAYAAAAAAADVRKKCIEYALELLEGVI